MKTRTILFTLFFSFTFLPKMTLQAGYFSNLVHKVSSMTACVASYATYTGFTDYDFVRSAANYSSNTYVNNVGNAVIDAGHFFNQTLQESLHLSNGALLGPFAKFPTFKVIGTIQSMIDNDKRSAAIYLADAGVNYALLLTVPEEYYAGAVATLSGIGFTVYRTAPTWIPLAKGTIQEIPRVLEAAEEFCNMMYGNGSL